MMKIPALNYPENEKTVVFTTTFFKSSSAVDSARSIAALRGAENILNARIQVVAVDGGSSREFLNKLAGLGVSIIEQSSPTLGGARRQALLHSLTLNPSFLVYSELEKDTFLIELPRIVQEMQRLNADIVIPARKSLISYPTFQRRSEELCNMFFETLVGSKLDIVFGPRVFKADLSRYFIDYQGEYGDRWDSIFIPVLRAIHSGAKTESVTVNYQNPPEQTQAESGSLEMQRKRIDQLASLTDAMYREFSRLNEVAPSAGAYNG